MKKITKYGKNDSKFVNKLKKISKNNENNKKPVAIVAIILVIGLVGGGILYGSSSSETINIASKPYTEQYILGYMLKELIEEKN
ncbi:hypothetical protein [Methanobrevibacter arboriphilus]|uniref:hypothetical protein n=1 Tax=Methanobrevibacter arboriphilus TaxID=39441 RepID=UPI000A437C91|nr:hypothetical protein [Methanobrevibacter arboriphilus]